MTAQMNDAFLLQDKRFSIVGVNGSGLFDPLIYNMQPLPRITSCWRGYVCTYKTLDNRLLLDSLLVNLDQEGPAINDIRPAFSNQGTFNNTYNGIKLQMDFTGGILVAYGFIQQLYVHMGFHPAWKYETVFELILSQGNVLDTRNVSSEMAQLRDKMTRQPLQPDRNTSKQEIEEWIASTFKRDYRF
jgi:hypothetical protein